MIYATIKLNKINQKMKIIIKWLISSVSLILVSYLIPGFGFDSFVIVLIAAFIFGIVNAIIRPLVLILTLPINIITLGLFTFVINALMLWLTHKLVPGFYIINFSTAVWAGLVYCIINLLINVLIINDNDK